MANPTDTTLAPLDAGANADAVAGHQRDIQKNQDQKDAAKAREADQKPAEQAEAQPPGVQAGARHQPDQLPAQHIDKPGLESELQLKPQFLAPGYKGSQKLSGMTALITGGDSGIGRAVAVLFAREGANVAIAYLNEHEDAQETARHVRNEGQRALLVPGDVKERPTARKPSRPCWKSSVRSTYWSTTPLSRSMPSRSKSSPRSASMKPCGPMSTATST